MVQHSLLHPVSWACAKRWPVLRHTTFRTSGWINAKQKSGATRACGSRRCCPTGAAREPSGARRGSASRYGGVIPCNNNHRGKQRERLDRSFAFYTIIISPFAPGASAQAATLRVAHDDRQRPAGDPGALRDPFGPRPRFRRRPRLRSTRLGPQGSPSRSNIFLLYISHT